MGDFCNFYTKTFFRPRGVPESLIWPAECVLSLISYRKYIGDFLIRVDFRWSYGLSKLADLLGHKWVSPANNHLSPFGAKPRKTILNFVTVCWAMWEKYDSQTFTAVAWGHEEVRSPFWCSMSVKALLYGLSKLDLLQFLALLSLLSHVFVPKSR